MQMTAKHIYTFPQDEDGQWFADIFEKKLKDRGYQVKRIASSLSISVQATNELNLERGVSNEQSRSKSR